MATATELKAWTEPGAQDAAKRTYDSVKAALARSAEVARYDVDVFLQGSYANATNTRGDSDVDIVVMMRSAYMPDLSQLNPLEQLWYRNAHIPATTTLQGLRTAVTNALNNYYAATRVHPRDKCIRVEKRDGYVDADVVPAQEYRLYTSFPATGAARWVEGISIEPLSGGRIVNYPKEHIDNGQTKNKRCGELYKPTVRQIKRLRRAAVDRALLGPKDAPGYLLECLTYNVPADAFVSDDTRRVYNALLWLTKFSPSGLASNIRSCDNVHWLFKTDPGKHNEHNAHRVLKVLWDFV
jgi:hypothetical protein